MEFQPCCGLQTQSEKRLAFLFSEVTESFHSSHIHSLVFLCVNQRLEDDQSKKQNESKTKN